MHRLLLFLFISLFVCFRPTSLRGQAADTVTVNLRLFPLPKLPLPGQAFQASRFSFKMPEGSTQDTVLHFTNVVIGKWDAVQMWIAVKGNRILKTGISASGAAMVKKIRKQMPKDFGPAFSLERYPDTDVVRWLKSSRQPYSIELYIRRDLTSCRFWISK